MTADRAEGMSGGTRVAARLGAVEGVGMAHVASAALGMATDQPGRVVEALESFHRPGPDGGGADLLALLRRGPDRVRPLERARDSIEELEAAAKVRGLAYGCPDPRITGQVGTAQGELERANELFGVTLEDSVPMTRSSSGSS